MHPSTRLPYHDFVHKIRPQWHQLRHLDDFMSKPKDHDFKVAVVDFDDAGGSIWKEFTKVPPLSDFLDCVPDGPIWSRLLIVEDPSRTLIEMLGSRYDLDPEFFSMHVVNHHWFGMCSSLETIPSSKGTIHEQSFLRMRYVEARRVDVVVPKLEDHRKRPFLGRVPLLGKSPLHGRAPRLDKPNLPGKSALDPKHEWTQSIMANLNSNVERKVSVMNLTSAHQPIGLARHHLTVWMKSTGPGGWIGTLSSSYMLIFKGIMLADKEVDLGMSDKLQWRQDKLPDFMPKPSFSASFIPQPAPATMYNSLLYYYRHCMTKEEAAVARRDSFYAIKFALRIIAGEWLHVCHILECELGLLGKRHEENLDLEFLQLELKRLYTWKRRSKRYTELVEQILEDCKWRGTSSWPRVTDGEYDAVKRANDFEAILVRFVVMRQFVRDQLGIVLDQLLATNSAIARKEGHDVRQLTLAAFIFFPLTWIAGLFSINDKLAVTSQLWWIYVVAAGVAVMLVLIVMQFWTRLVRGKNSHRQTQRALSPENVEEFWYPADSAY